VQIAKKTVRRRQILIERNAQLYLSLLMLLHVVIYTISLLIFILAPSVLGFMGSDHPIEERFKASREFLLLDQRVVPAAVLVMIVMGLNFIFLTNRVFGPLYRLKKVLAGWRGGVWPPRLSVRPKDFHRDLFSSFSDTSEQLKADLGGAAADLTRAEAGLNVVASRGDIPPETARIVTETAGKCAQALSVLKKYGL
jgi:hypothetical protein